MWRAGRVQRWRLRKNGYIYDALLLRPSPTTLLTRHEAGSLYALIPHPARSPWWTSSTASTLLHSTEQELQGNPSSTTIFWSPKICVDFWPLYSSESFHWAKVRTWWWGTPVRILERKGDYGTLERGWIQRRNSDTRLSVLARNYSQPRLRTGVNHWILVPGEPEMVLWWHLFCFTFASCLALKVRGERYWCSRLFPNHFKS